MFPNVYYIYGPNEQEDRRRAAWTNAGTSRLQGASTMNDDREQSWRYELHHQPTFDLPPARNCASPFSTAANTGSARPADRSAGVPYSVTCPSRFDGCLGEAVGHARPPRWQVPRPSISGEPVTSAAVRRLHEPHRPQSCQTSSVFEISSYIITNSASNASVQPTDVVDL